MAARTVLIMAGGTGGHIFPGLAIAAAMRARAWNVEWLGTFGGMEAQLVPRSNLRIHFIHFEGVIGKGLFAKLKLPFKLASALYSTRRIFKRIRPHVVVGMGGYPALPGGLMASWMNIPLITHEQNAVPGQTNRVLASRATRVLCAFAGTYRALRIKAEPVGNPVRSAISNVGDTRLQWDGGRPLRIAVIGGSRGAQILNEVIPQSLAKIPSLQRPQVIHQCGKGRADAVRSTYRSLQLTADVREFIDDMAALYAQVDLVICRSGASTVSELACAQMPAIFIPYPYHADQQQLHNAQVLVSTGGALLMEQKDLDSEVLAHTLMNLSVQQLTTMRQILKTNATPHATELIAGIIEEVGQRHEI